MNIHKKLILIILFLFNSKFLFSQNLAPIVIEEKKPTTRSPNYQPPSIPFFLKRRTQQNPAEIYISNPNISIEEFLQVKQQKKETPSVISNYEEFLLNHLSNQEIQRYYFQKYFLPQVGIENIQQWQPFLFDFRELQEPETKWERRFTIFMLSFPITTGFSYGIYRTYKTNQNLPSSLNKTETIGIVTIGIISSLFIVYHDEHFYKGIKNYTYFLQKAREKE
ncbi:MAG: hypothetical protein ACK4UJ_11205 [Leptonema sp. (in: bacteria)]